MRCCGVVEVAGSVATCPSVAQYVIVTGDAPDLGVCSACLGPTLESVLASAELRLEASVLRVDPSAEAGDARWLRLIAGGAR